jgi:hypothetical protein
MDPAGLQDFCIEKIANQKAAENKEKVDTNESAARDPSIEAVLEKNQSDGYAPETIHLCPMGAPEKADGVVIFVSFL